MTVTIGAVLFALACVITLFFRRTAAAERRSAVSEVTSVLEKAGFASQGDVLGTFSLRGLVHGVEVELMNRTNKLPPGDLENHVSACVVRVAVPIADQIVFNIDKIDQVMGLLPTAPRVRTGHPPFDHVYAVFVVSTAEATGGSYRSTASASAVPWGQSLLLDRLAELGLLWMRVKEGHAEIVFPSLPVNEVGRAAALAAAVARTSLGKPPPALVGGPRAPWVAWPNAVTGLNFAWGLGAVLALALGAFLSPDDNMNAKDTGWAIMALSSTVIAGASFIALRRGWTSS